MYQCCCLRFRLNRTGCSLTIRSISRLQWRSEQDCGSLERASEIRGDLLVAFGTRDPHVSFEGRAKIYAGLHAAGTHFRAVEYDAEHAFMRDEGPRYDPAATDAAMLEAITFFRSAFA